MNSTWAVDFFFSKWILVRQEVSTSGFFFFLFFFFGGGGGGGGGGHNFDERASMHLHAIAILMIQLRVPSASNYLVYWTG